MAIMTQKTFSTWVELYKSQHPEISYLTSVMMACDHFVVEYSLVKPLITPQLFQRLEAEAIESNVLKVKKTSHNLDEFFK